MDVDLFLMLKADCHETFTASLRSLQKIVSSFCLSLLYFTIFKKTRQTDTRTSNAMDVQEAIHTQYLEGKSVAG